MLLIYLYAAHITVVDRKACCGCYPVVSGDVHIVITAVYTAFKAPCIRYRARQHYAFFVALVLNIAVAYLIYIYIICSRIQQRGQINICLTAALDQE